MDFKEKISLETFGNKQFRIKLIEPENNQEAVLTHYLHNSKNGVSRFYKEDAIAFTKEILEHKYPEHEVSNEAAEEALQYGIFDTFDVPFPPIDKPKFKFIDLFAGIGGFRLALQNLGGKCVFTSEWDKDAKRTYKANFGETPFGDITKEETKQYIPDNFDVLCAGFPCQAFSIAGKRGGFEDTRGTLFFDVAEIIKRKQPKAVFLENVKGLRNHNGGKTLATILNVLRNDLGYFVPEPEIVNAKDFGVPQNRERIYIVGFESKTAFESFEFPEELDLTMGLDDIIDFETLVDETFYYREGKQPFYEKLEEEITSKATVYQWRRQYVRENKSGVVPTLTANMGTGGHNVPLILTDYGIRKLTPRETFNAQGYPSDYELPDLAISHLYKQAGNSVVVPVIKRIAKNILLALKQGEESLELNVSDDANYAIVYTDTFGNNVGKCYVYAYANDMEEVREILAEKNDWFPLIGDEDYVRIIKNKKALAFYSIVTL